MPHHIKTRKLAFYRMLRRNFRGELHVRVLDEAALRSIIPNKPIHQTLYLVA